jgi:hypothetical protein
LGAGSTRFLEVTFTDEVRPFYRLEEMPDDAGRAAVLAGKRVQKIKYGDIALLPATVTIQPARRDPPVMERRQLPPRLWPAAASQRSD